MLVWYNMNESMMFDNAYDCWTSDFKHTRAGGGELCSLKNDLK